MSEGSANPVQTIELPVLGGRRAALALPEGAGPWPGVVIVHDITGWREDTRRHCAWFASLGYAAIAPDVFGGGNPACVVRTLLSLRQGRGEGLEIIAAARQHLVGLAGVRADAIAVMGFCMGGGFALLAAADDSYAVAAPFYGPVPPRAERLQGVCPTIAQFGARDLPFRSVARQLSSYLVELGVPHEVLMHEGAGHAFMNDHSGLLFKCGQLTPLRAGYDAGVEAEARAAMLAFFERHLPAAVTPPATPEAGP